MPTLQIAYYHLNQEEIDADIAAEEAEGELKEIRFEQQ